MLCPVSRLQHLYVYFVWWSIFIWFVKPHMHCGQSFTNGVYSFTTWNFCSGAERGDSHLLAVLWQLLSPCLSPRPAHSSLCGLGNGLPGQLQLGQHHDWALWCQVIPLRTKQNPGQSRTGPGDLNAHLWSYLNLCGSRGISFVASTQKCRGDVSLLDLHWMPFVCTPFTWNQIHTCYAHRWNTTQRTLSQELFPVLSSPRPLFSTLSNSLAICSFYSDCTARLRPSLSLPALCTTEHARVEMGMSQVWYPKFFRLLFFLHACPASLLHFWLPT